MRVNVVEKKEKREMSTGGRLFTLHIPVYVACHCATRTWSAMISVSWGGGRGATKQSNYLTSGSRWAPGRGCIYFPKASSWPPSRGPRRPTSAGGLSNGLSTKCQSLADLLQVSTMYLGLELRAKTLLILWTRFSLCHTYHPGPNFNKMK